MRAVRPSILIEFNGNSAGNNLMSCFAYAAVVVIITSNIGCSVTEFNFDFRLFFLLLLCEENKRCVKENKRLNLYFLTVQEEIVSPYDYLAFFLGSLSDTGAIKHYFLSEKKNVPF
jgi:hypothetical protein